MTYIGNDIVDVVDAIATSNHTNIPWLNKNFNPEEQDYIFISKNPSTALWKLWSCKESAYKVIVKKEGSRFLNAKRIGVNCMRDSENISKITYNGYDLWVKTLCHTRYIHSVCSFSLQAIDQSHFQVIPCKGTLDEKSSIVRRVLTENLQSIYRSDIEVAFTKDKLGIPAVAMGTLPVQIDISFSHDTAYSAYSFISNEVTE